MPGHGTFFALVALVALAGYADAGLASDSLRGTQRAASWLASSEQSMWESAAKSVRANAVALMHRVVPGTASEQAISTSSKVGIAVSWVPFAVLVALVYKFHMKRKVKQQKTHHEDFGKWSTGLFDFWQGQRNEIFICCCAFQFPSIRWADTVSQAGLGNFWIWFLAMLFLITMPGVVAALFFGSGSSPLIGWAILACLGTYFRVQLRNKFGMKTDHFTDFAQWCCCMPCVVAQEARHVEGAIANRWGPTGVYTPRNN